MSTVQRMSAMLQLMVLSVIVVVMSGCSTIPLNTTPAGPPSVPQSEVLPPPSEVIQPETDPPIPALTNGYVVYAYRCSDLVNGTWVTLDRKSEEEAAGRTRDPADFKASALNATCVAVADGNGLTEEGLCTNRANCRLPCPLGQVADRTPAER